MNDSCHRVEDLHQEGSDGVLDLLSTGLKEEGGTLLCVSKKEEVRGGGEGKGVRGRRRGEGREGEGGGGGERERVREEGREGRRRENKRE